MISITVLTLTACAPSFGLSGGTTDRHCSDVVARALTSPDHTVVGAFACMSRDEQDFWHRWAISRDDQLPQVVRFNGLTTAGPVDGYDNQVQWASAAYVADLDDHHRLYLVRSLQDPAARGFLVLTTTNVGLVQAFTISLYQQ
jgi:hypothetical protein